MPFITHVENAVQPGRPQMTIWRMRIARWIPKATITYSEYVLLIAFPLQKWLNESAPRVMLYVRHFACRGTTFKTKYRMYTSSQSASPPH